MMQKNPYMTVLDDEQKFEVTEFVRKSILIIDSSNLVPETRTLDVSKVGYEIDIIDAFDVAHDDEIEHGKNVTNYYLVHTDLPFPVEAIQFNTSHIVEPHKEYEFELISFFDASNTLKNNSVNVDITIDNGDTNDVIVESGTIELTLPDDETDSTNDVDDNTENQNDDEIIEINDTNKNNDDSADNTQDQNDNHIEDTINIDDAVTTKENVKSKSSSMTMLVLVIGIAVAAIFVYFKKFRKKIL